MKFPVRIDRVTSDNEYETRIIGRLREELCLHCYHYIRLRCFFNMVPFDNAGNKCPQFCREEG
jgi:hypothetical protein